MEILGGPFYSVAGAGESHGPAVTTIVMGCPPGQYIRRADVKRSWIVVDPGGTSTERPGTKKIRSYSCRACTKTITTSCWADRNYWRPLMVARSKPKATRKATQPASRLLRSYSRPAKSRAITPSSPAPTGQVRPGHTDLVKFHKSAGYVDVRGGGRSSYRATITDVIGGSIARIVLREKFNTVILSSISQVGPLRADASLSDRFGRSPQPQAESTLVAQTVAQIDASEIPSIDAEFAIRAAELIKDTSQTGDSLGIAVEAVLRSTCRRFWGIRCIKA